MEQNDPGREPEPTDAELLKELARQYVEEIESNWPNRIWDRVEIAADRGREYLSGERPMPDTPAPSTAAPVIGSNQCEHGHLARVCVHCELIAAETLIARQSDLLTGVANALKGQAGETELWSHADLPEMAERVTARNAALEAERDVRRVRDRVAETQRARIADLEQQNADLKRMVCAVQPSADHESLYCHDIVFRGVTMNWFDARDKMLSDGKEPTDAE